MMKFFLYNTADADHTCVAFNHPNEIDHGFKDRLEFLPGRKIPYIHMDGKIIEGRWNWNDGYIEGRLEYGVASPLILDTIECGKPFMMINYPSVYIRIKADRRYTIKREAAMGITEYSFNDDGCHVPIVDLYTGHMFYMSKKKPCEYMSLKVSWEKK